MKKELLFSLLLASASLTASFNCAADWHDTAGLTPEAPPEELIAAAAAAAAPGALPGLTATVTTAIPTTVSAPEPIPTFAPAPVAAPLPASAPVPVAAPTAVAEPTPVQDEVLPAPAYAPADVIKSVTPVVSTWNTQRATAIVLRPATLRTRPTATGTGDPIDAETRVRMESNITNAEGNWWYVTATGIGGGWLLEKELGDPQN